MASARKRKDCFTSFLFVLPLLALFLVFFAYPIIYNIVISKFCHYCNNHYGCSVSTWTYAGILFHQKDKVFRVL